jgi:hypothetical protein
MPYIKCHAFEWLYLGHFPRCHNFDAFLFLQSFNFMTMAAENRPTANGVKTAGIGSVSASVSGENRPNNNNNNNVSGQVARTENVFLRR